MKKILVSISIISVSVLFAHAATYSINMTNDVVRTSNPIDTQFGYDASFLVDVPNPIPASSSYTVHVSGKSVNQAAGMNNIVGVRVNVSDGLNNFTSTGFGDSWGNFTSGSSGVVNFTILGRPSATCTAFGGDCTIPNSTEYLSNIPIQQSASVTLQISGF